ncbi:hypothetical protein OIE52_49415 [Streptomyces canus]|uniref:hypothetical protein n=1 Tax=Streptomyces canus TaxID=58343 RepID=UPI0030DFF91D
MTLLSRIAATHPGITKAWVNVGYRTTAIDRGAYRGIGWLMHHRRLARDYERHPYRSEVMLHLAMIGLTARRLPGEAFPTWRGT